MPFQTIDHPLVQHKLTLLRDRETGPKEFRELLAEVSALLCYEATRGLQMASRQIETPIGPATGARLKSGQVVLVPVLRAGLGMVEGALRILPGAKVGHIGLYRDPETHLPVEYYRKLPQDIAARDVLLVDPMLATGGSAARAIEILHGAGVERLRLVCLVAAPEGVRAALAVRPDLEIYGAALDSGLNDHAYIVPGLGDAGDRLYGTE